MHVHVDLACVCVYACARACGFTSSGGGGGGVQIQKYPARSLPSHLYSLSSYNTIHGIGASLDGRTLNRRQLQ